MVWIHNEDNSHYHSNPPFWGCICGQLQELGWVSKRIRRVFLLILLTWRVFKKVIQEIMMLKHKWLQYQKNNNVQNVKTVWNSFISVSISTGIQLHSCFCAFYNPFWATLGKLSTYSTNYVYASIKYVWKENTNNLIYTFWTFQILKYNHISLL